MLRFFSRVCVLAVVLLLSGSMRADSFTVWNFASDNQTVLGINAAGEVLYTTPGNNNFYLIYDQGMVVYDSRVFPAFFVADNGLACGAPAVPAGNYTSGPSVCNGGRQVYGLASSNSPYIVMREIYPGSDALGDVAASLGTALLLKVNAAGDFAYVDAHNQTLRQVIVTQTPEPGSLALVGTGVVGAVGAFRRRGVGLGLRRKGDGR